MGVVCAGFLHIITLFLHRPGIVAPNSSRTSRPDQAYSCSSRPSCPPPQRLILPAWPPPHVTLSTVLNSPPPRHPDFYKKLINPPRPKPSKSASTLERLVLLIVSIASPWIRARPSAFRESPKRFFYIAPPSPSFHPRHSVRRANATAALATIISGFAFTGSRHLVVPRISFLIPYNTYSIVRCSPDLCMTMMVTVSLLHPAPP